MIGHFTNDDRVLEFINSNDLNRLASIGVEIMRKQNVGGDVINIVSKKALVSGPNNAAYGSAKAAQLHLTA